MAGPAPEASHVLMLTDAHLDEMIAHCLRAYPYEGCGLLVGKPGENRVTRCIPTRNVASSSRLYEIDPRDLLRTDREATNEGAEIIGVFHSHTHTDPYPSPTDVAQAPDPSWHYVLVSFRSEVTSTRSYRIVNGEIEEESIVTSEEPDVAGRRPTEAL